MSCVNACNKKVTENQTPIVSENCGHNSTSLIVIVLYILLAIIIGSYIL